MIYDNSAKVQELYFNYEIDFVLNLINTLLTNEILTRTGFSPDMHMTVLSRRL